jgi:hypothetical protein
LDNDGWLNFVDDLAGKTNAKRQNQSLDPMLARPNRHLAPAAGRHHKASSSSSLQAVAARARPACVWSAEVQ